MTPPGQAPAIESQIGIRRAKRRTSTNERSNLRWDTIVTTAADVFHRVGYEQSTLDDIALAVGVNRASLYYYVSTKGELLAAILNEPLREYIDDLTRSIDPHDSAADQMRAAVRGHMSLLARHYPGLMLLLTDKNVIDDPELHALIGSNSVRHRRLLAGIIKRGISSGEFTPGIDTSVAALGILGMCNDTRSWWRPGRMSLEDVGDVFADIIVSGLTVKPARRARATKAPAKPEPTKRSARRDS